MCEGDLLDQAGTFYFNGDGHETKRIKNFERNLRMTIEANKQQMHRFTEFINTASVKLAEELIAPDAIFYVPAREDAMKGPDGYLAIIQMMRTGFPDIQWTLKEMVAEGDKVAARFIMRGTHQGSFFGFPPTGKPSRFKR